MLKLTLTEISKYVSSCLCNLIITCYQNVLQKIQESRMRFTYNTKDHGNNIMFCRDLTVENVN